MKPNKFHITISDESIAFPEETFQISQIDHFEIDHRAFLCTLSFIIFMIGSVGCLFFAPEMIILVAGCFFVWLRVEYSRYVELKVCFKDGTVRRILSCSFGEREQLYALDNRLKRLFPVKEEERNGR